MKLYQRSKADQNQNKIYPIRYSACAGRGAAFAGNKFVILKMLSTCDIYFNSRPELCCKLKIYVIEDLKTDIDKIIEWLEFENDKFILYGSSIILSYKTPVYLFDNDHYKCSLRATSLYDTHNVRTTVTTLLDQSKTSRPKLAMAKLIDFNNVQIQATSENYKNSHLTINSGSIIGLQNFKKVLEEISLEVSGLK